MPYRYAIALLALTACTNVSSDKTTEADMPKQRHQPVSVSPKSEYSVDLFTFIEAKPVPGQPAPTFHQVAMTGILGIRNRCLILESGERQFALVFREGTAEFDPTSNILTVEGKHFALGTIVSMGGSGGSAVESLPHGDPKNQCATDDTWIVVPGSFELGN